MRRLILTLHLVVALAAGVFLLILGVTGSIMAFEPELGRLMHRRESYVVPGVRAKSLADLGAAASAAVGGQTPSAFALSTDPSVSYQVIFRGRVAYVNQYTGDVLGVRDSGPDLLARIHQLHLRLLLPNTRTSDPGQTIVKWAGVAMFVLLASGVYLWWPLKRVRISRSGNTRRFWFDLHNAVGIGAAVFLFVAAATGVVIGFDDAIVPLVYRATSTQPLAVYGRPAFTSTPSGAPIPVDRALEIARAALPGASPVLVNVPGRTGVYAVNARFPEDLTPGGRSRIYIDQYTGRVLLAEGSRTAPAGTRLVTLNRALHTGDVFGTPSRLLMCLVSLTVVVQLVSGLSMWLLKRAAARRPRDLEAS